jgi:Asp-tRNA(Asn)/Glu-tRNA(Gln) amidotransferase B subunit
MGLENLINSYIEHTKKSMNGDLDSVKYCLDNSNIYEILPYYCAVTKDPLTFCFLKGLLRWQTTQEDIIKVLKENNNLVEKYKNGEIKLKNVIIGKVLSKLKGAFPEDIEKALLII